MKKYLHVATRGWAPERVTGLALVGGLLCGLPLAGAESRTNGPILANLSFEQLSQIQVVTAAKRSELLADTPAAISVITSEDIACFGATTIPEALRYVPGLEVAQINAHDWAISARGNNSRFANKQLVVVDGRTIYTPFSGGVYWEAAGPPVGEIERIEVIRGPGGTVWGANAVNGVINIITKSAQETQGTVVSAGGGPEKPVLSYGRSGFQLGEHTWARVYGGYSRTDAAALASGAGANDAWQDGRGGVRVDSDLSEVSHVMFQSEVSDTRLDDPGYYPTLTPPFRAAIPEELHQLNAHVLGRWTQDFSADNQLTVQSFWAHEQRDQFRNDFRNDTFDLDLTHQFKWGERQTIVWGGGARYVAHELNGKVGVVFPDPNPTDELYNVFIQDEIQLLPDCLAFTLGSKLEHNNVTGVECEPGVQIVWKPTGKQTVWGSISRAVHPPSVLERDILFDAAVVNPPLTILRQISTGNEQTTAQLTYQLGYRIEPLPRLSLDAAVYYNDLQEIQVFRQGTPFPEAVPAPAHNVLPLQIGLAGADGESYGLELSATWQATDKWRLFAEYSCYHEQVNLLPGQSTFSAQSPRHRCGVRSSLDLPHHWQLDFGVRYVDEIPGTSIGSYVTGDARLAWRPSDHWEFSLVGLNLFDHQHPEMSPSTLAPIIEIERSVYVMVTWKL